MNDYIVTLRLSGFLGSEIIEREDYNGNKVNGIFIPFGENGIDPMKDNTVLVNMFASENSYPNGKSHYLKLKTTKRKMEKIMSLGFKLPTLGFMRINNFSKSKFYKNGG
jgi:hypothetical protein